MWSILERLAQLSRPVRLGLMAAGTVAAGGAVAVLSPRTEDPAKQVQPAPSPAPPAPAFTAEASSTASDELGLDGLEESPTPIEVKADPEVLKWPDDHSVELSGTTAIDAENPRVTLTVTAPSGRSYELDPLPVTIDGSFATEFDLFERQPEASAPGETRTSSRLRYELGTFQVTAVSPGGFGSATATFTTTRYDEVKTYDWQEPADRLAQRALDLVANLKTCLANMPVSPARDELSTAVHRLEAVVKQGGAPNTRLGSFLALVLGDLGKFPDEAPILEELIEPLEDQLNAWGKAAERFEKEVRHDPQRCAAAGACDRADMIVHDLDRLKDLTTLLERPMDLIGGYRTSPELKGALRRQSMPDTAFFHHKLERAKAALDGAHR